MFSDEISSKDIKYFTSLYEGVLMADKISLKGQLGLSALGRQ